ncbi:hypothetical protein [Nocardia acidivorans]|uniref:hypothetical protein n=1 Tax=Nocardia acidivorans TaxID=404580 RepID=UPI001FE112DC|nr:hypothetical protein [Nocardia acidivorans]
MTARVGAVHLGWDVVSVAAGGGGASIRPIQVEGTYTPPAYLLADASGRLHTAGVDRRPDVGIAISDVRDILGHPQIVVAGATWPADLVFRARMHNPLAAVTEHLGGPPDVLAVPFPDEWPDPKVDEFIRLVEQLGVVAEALPESVALSGYIRALGLVRPPGRGPEVGATGVYSDGRDCLVVAVHGDDEAPTESVSVPITAEALHSARAADNVVIEVMAAARGINADTSTVLLAGNVCFNDALRLAFQNHLGHRFHVADHPMHALVLGATHLLVNDSELSAEAVAARSETQIPQPGSAMPRHADHGGRVGPPTGDYPRHGQQSGAPAQAGTSAQPGTPAQAGTPGTPPRPGMSGQPGAHVQPGMPAKPGTAAAEAPVGGAEARPVDQGPRKVVQPSGSGAARAESPRPAGPSTGPQPQTGVKPPTSPLPASGTLPSTNPVPAAAQGAQPGADAGETRRITAEDAAQIPTASRGGLPPGLAGVGGRFTRPPGTPADDQMTSVMGRGQPPGPEGYGQPGGPQWPSGNQPNPAAGQQYPGGGQQYSTGQQQQYPGGQPPASGAQQSATGGQQSGGPANPGAAQPNPPVVQYGPGYGPQGQSGYGQQGAAQPGYGQSGQGNYGQQGGVYGQGGYGQQGANFPGPSGNAPGQAGAMYGGSMPQSGSRQSNPQMPEDSAGQSDSASGEGEHKRRSKLWNKMKGKRFGAPIIIGMAALGAMGMHSDSEPLELSALTTHFTIRDVLDTHLIDQVCAITPSASNAPRPGVSGIDDPEHLDCLTLGIDTLRYTVPGPVRGGDPGPPVQI